MKILHFADIHARDNDIEEIEKCLNVIVQAGWDESPELIVCAGDVFDSQNVKLDSKAVKMVFSVFSELADIAPVAVVIGTPSHDGTAAEVLRHVKARHPVRVSKRPEQFLLVRRENDESFIDDQLLAGGDYVMAIISMVPTPTKQFFNSSSDIKGSDNEIAQAMGAMFGGFGARAAGFPGTPHIMVGHFQVGGAFFSATQQLSGPDIEISEDQIGYGQAGIVLLGHLHFHQRIGTNIFYSGSIYRKDFGELDIKGFYIHEIFRCGLLSSRFIETPARKLIKITKDFTSRNHIEEANELIEIASIDYDDIEDAYIRVELKVYQDEAGKIDREKITEIFSGAADVDIRIIRVPRENVRSSHILKLVTLRDKILEMARLKSELVPDSVLAKADFLETMTPEQVMSVALAGGTLCG
jgi:DNA repair exonuclease SbcCD nuclease subunit